MYKLHLCNLNKKSKDFIPYLPQIDNRVNEKTNTLKTKFNSGHANAL